MSEIIKKVKEQVKAINAKDVINLRKNNDKTRENTEKINCSLSSDVSKHEYTKWYYENVLMVAI